MADVRVTYAGLELANPIIAGASGLTSNVDHIRKLEDAGVGAVVTKSLMEEEIQLERFKFDEDGDKYNNRHPEMIQVFPDTEYSGPEEHLSWVRKAKDAVGIPVIGSLNAVCQDTWLEYAVQLEQTGVDALECNLFSVPREMDRAGDTVEREQVALVKELKKRLSIPVIVKLSYLYANPLNVVSRMDEAGADAFVLFNRLFEPDLDIEELSHDFSFNFSHATDYRLPLRYAGWLEGHLQADLCCSTGIHSGETLVKMLLAGADVVQIVTALYRNGRGHIAKMLGDVSEWMDRREYRALDDFRGQLSKRHTRDPWAYTRTQYARLLMNPEELIKNAPVP